VLARPAPMRRRGRLGGSWETSLEDDRDMLSVGVARDARDVDAGRQGILSLRPFPSELRFEI
jgi:hypothetical protein